MVLGNKHVLKKSKLNMHIFIINLNWFDGDNWKTSFWLSEREKFYISIFNFFSKLLFSFVNSFFDRLWSFFQFFFSLILQFFNIFAYLFLRFIDCLLGWFGFLFNIFFYFIFDVFFNLLDFFIERLLFFFDFSIFLCLYFFLQLISGINCSYNDCCVKSIFIEILICISLL